jgi:3(or 17)beta-hydroxysteroid dehydrogenase
MVSLAGRLFRAAGELFRGRNNCDHRPIAPALHGVLACGMGRVQDKIALITGGASGIGLAAAKLFAEEGATVIIADRDEAAGRSAAAALAPQTSFHRLDVTSETDWLTVADAVVRDHGRLDILVNSAGVVLFKDIEQTTLDEWRALMAVNLDGTFLGCKQAVRVMKDRGGGSIVNMSSVAGLIGSGNLAAYSASKGGVRLLTKSVALHCARKAYNIRCNSVHPSFAETPMLQGMLASARNPEKLAANFATAAPLGRMAQPIEIARAILFLASDESAFTTGAELVVDGGLTAA